MTPLDESYRLLELSPRASDEEVRRAHRESDESVAPDRFGHDPELRRRAEEKLKAINEAWEAIRESRRAGGGRHTLRKHFPARAQPRVGRRLRSHRTVRPSVAPPPPDW
jgi:curved DNA-binding protein CbpA